ncbi:hypothetical protein [Streptomyces sp. 147326]|uniref:hypothetical protein n=1 Tax=Streptomyces sp. 147326 TaxID=3074379 RepID=UPI003857ABFA
MSGHGVEAIDEGPVFGAQMGPGVGQGPDEAGCVVVGQGPVQFADGRRGGVGKVGEGGARILRQLPGGHALLFGRAELRRPQLAAA